MKKTSVGVPSASCIGAGNHPKKTTVAEASRQFDLASLEFGGGYHCQYFKNKNEDREYRDFHSLKSGL